jgi:hypothetical protein
MSLIEQQPSRGARRYLLLGLVPDGVRVMKVTPDHGPQVTVPVIDDVYAYVGPTPARAVVDRPTAAATRP